LHDVASDEVQLETQSRSQTDDLHSQKAGNSILNGWLIEQVSFIVSFLMLFSVLGIIIPDVFYRYKEFIQANGSCLSMQNIARG
jgi:hypothetical protein